MSATEQFASLMRGGPVSDRAIRVVVGALLEESGHDWHYFTPVDRPKGMRKRAHLACFRNARTVVADDRYPDLAVYAEGFANDENGCWCHHAWVVDRYGNAIDPTWQVPGSTYYGTRISTGDGCDVDPALAPAVLAAVALRFMV